MYIIGIIALRSRVFFQKFIEGRRLLILQICNGNQYPVGLFVLSHAKVVPPPPRFMLRLVIIISKTNMIYFEQVGRKYGLVGTKAMRSVKRYGCYAKNPEFGVIPTSVNTVINV